MIQLGQTRLERRAACEMRDGTILYADIYRPAQSGSYPVLLMRQLYGRQLASTVTSAHPVWYAQHGYVVVVQDVRGIGDSQGELEPFLQEEADGYDTVQWASELPEANGRVGMYGFSYQGFTQLAAAAAAPPQLVAIAPGMTAADLYHERFYPHGRFAWGGQLRWAFQIARDQAARAGDNEGMVAAHAWMQQPGQLLWKTAIASRHELLERYCPFFYDWIEQTNYNAYWERRNWVPKLRANPIPSFHIGGWYDTFLGGTLQSYRAMRQARHDPQQFHHLLIGPWPHIPWGRMTGGIDHGPEADGDVHIKQLRWFDYWLKGDRSQSLFAQAPVQYFEYGSMRWRSAEQLPDVGKGSRSRYYLGGGAKPANGALGGGRLRLDAPADAQGSTEVFVYDARLPMPCESYAPSDRSAAADRYEILVYTSEPLNKPLCVWGEVLFSTFVQVLEGPTDLVAILSLVEPDGAKTRFLSIGREEVGGGAHVEKVSVVMRAFAACFPAGSRLRLELSGSAFPLMARHPNGIPASEIPHAAALNIATVAVQHSAKTPSYLELVLADGEVEN